jgi:D-3-phosphoglycerate dehydrogenase / 2-oxoglutarate reductase
MIQVVITDCCFEPLDVESAILEPLGCRLTVHQCKTPDELLPVVADADCIITQFAPHNANVIAAMRQARVIVRYGVGVDNIDLEAAHRHGIPVCNVPDYCINEVADHALAFILATTRQVRANDAAVRASRWGLGVPRSAMKTLAEMAVGIIGFGRIGRAVAARLASFGCRLLVFDPYVEESNLANPRCTRVTLEELLSQSDLLTLHCPSSAETRRLLNRARIAQLKRGAIVINVSRGDLIETVALVDALHSGHVAAAGLDVFDAEPLPADSPLLKMDQVIVSAHVASVSLRAMRKLRETVAQTVACAVRGEPLPNVVNGVQISRVKQLAPVSQ